MKQPADRYCVVVATKVRPATGAALEREAARRGTTPSALVRETLEGLLAERRDAA